MSEYLISIAALMCHAPVVLPEIAKDRMHEIQATTKAMETAAQTVLQHNPEVLIVLSPHSPRLENNFGIMQGLELSGSFEMFGAPELSYRFKNDVSMTTLLTQHYSGLKTIPSKPLDHGALVPLSFLSKAGWDGPTVLISFPYYSTLNFNQEFGEQIAIAAQQDSTRKWGIIASGDMSHRLLPESPAGYHPQAQTFDHFITKNIKAGNYQKALQVDQNLRTLAAEDVIDSLSIAAAATNYCTDGHHFLSYEGPFGVGYLVSILCTPKKH